MSRSASIDIGFEGYKTNSISPTTIIKKLLNYGWTLNDNEKMSYLPIGDKGMFEWTCDNISKIKLINILKQKEQLNETIGINMTWEKTKIGGSFLFLESNTLSISLTINRKILMAKKYFKVTDINWYMEKIIPPINTKHIKIEWISYEEHV